MDRDREPDQDLASELRREAANEWLAEAAEDERLTETHRRRQLTLADRAAEMANRGDRVSVEFGGHSFGGAVVAAGSDYVTVSGPGQDADLRMEAARWSILPLDSQGEAAPARSENFQALLHEHSDGGRTVRLALPGGDMVIGTIAVVSADNVEVKDVDGRLLVVPTNLILGIVRSSEH